MGLSVKNLNSKSKNFYSWLDLLAIFTWSALLIKYSIGGQLQLLIHPSYFWLVSLTGVILLCVSIFKVYEILKFKDRTAESRNAIGYANGQNSLEHINLFPPGWSSGLLIATAILGFLISPNVLNSQTALQRGMTESLPLTRSQPQSFRTNTNPEDRSLLDWIRTINAYPEPDAYIGQTAKVTGFVIHSPNLPDNYLLIGRFVITCCAIDAYPVGIPVKIIDSRDAYPQDTWLEVEGKMIAENLTIDRTNTIEESTQQRQLAIAATSLKKIPTPKDPYTY
jgi:putative membrane protein